MSEALKARLAAQAEHDFRMILTWTREHFGKSQATVYAETLRLALEALLNGPDIPGSRIRPELGAEIRVLHVARNGRKGRHFIVFDGSMAGRIQVVRILHDSMDLARHVTADDETEH